MKLILEIITALTLMFWPEKLPLRERLDRFLNSGNVDGALNYLADYYRSHPDFPGLECHDLAHYVGDKAATINPVVDSLSFANGDICQYGFYHAFMGNYIRQNRLNEAIGFCDRVGREISGGAADACYHGLGHGAVYVFNEEMGLADISSIVDAGTKLCQSAFNADEHKTYWCLTGIYNGLPDVIKIRPEAREIYPLCSREEAVNQPVCYEYLSMWLNDWSALDAVPQKYQPDAARGIVTTLMHQPPGLSLDEGLAICAGLEPQLVSACTESVNKAVGEYQ